MMSDMEEFIEGLIAVTYISCAAYVVVNLTDYLLRGCL